MIATEWALDDEQADTRLEHHQRFHMEVDHAEIGADTPIRTTIAA